MAARRLIAILLVLLFLSSLAAALAPVQRDGKSVTASTTSSTTTTTGPGVLPEAPAAAARLIRQKIEASTEKPPVVRAHVGDQLQLRVTSKRPGTIELVRLGVTEDTGPDEPAFFDVLLQEAGSFPAVFLGTKTPVAQIKVSPTVASPPR